ncbi:MAG: phosphonate metabolism transcriptional regulator PhnF [Hyphomicrobiales bacterium]
MSTTGTAWRRIADDLAALIQRGDFAIGASLPTALELASRYGVHRHTARQAFRHLQDLGLVSVEQGRGTFVTGKPFPYRIGRQVSFRQNFAAAGIETSGQVIASEVVEAGKLLARALLVPEGTLVWALRTFNLAAGLPISTAMHYLDVERFPNFETVLQQEHASISAAFRAYGIDHYQRLATRLSARLATQAECELLAISEAAPVLTSEGLDGLAGGEPIHLVLSAFAPERVEFVIEPDALTAA